MNRRRLCYYATLSALGLAGIISGNSLAAPKNRIQLKKSRHRWVVLYWMPYDNDLSWAGERIVKMLQQGMHRSEIAVVIQSDYFGATKMRRRQIGAGSVRELTISDEPDAGNSSNSAILAAYLDWAAQTFVADHWAVIVVGHGGKTNEISPDDHTANSQNRTWMKVSDFARLVSAFNHRIGERVELLFFQNCNKATLEAVYETRNCARYTLASQLALGVPNYYYKGFLHSLNEGATDGHEAAIAIINSERSDMYHSLTVVDNQAVKNLPVKLSALLQSLLTQWQPEAKLAKPPMYTYFGETYCDVMTLLDYLVQACSANQGEIAEFAYFLRTALITQFKTGGTLYGPEFLRQPGLDNLCGLGLYFPESLQAVERYTSLALHQEIDLVSLYQKILAP